MRHYDGSIDWLSVALLALIAIVVLGCALGIADLTAHRDTIIQEPTVNGVTCYRHYGSMQVWCNR